MNLNFKNLNFEQFLKALVALLMAVCGVLYVDKRISESEHKTEMREMNSEIKLLNQKHLEYVEATDKKVDELTRKLDELKFQIEMKENHKK